MALEDRLETEEAIIQGFLAPLAAGAPGAHGLKDDCATIAPSPGCELVLKTDAVAEGVHFLIDDDPADIGWKALAVNVSDLAAKGACPLGYLMSLAFPKAPTRTWMKGFARGLNDAQSAFGMHLLGGDTDRRPGPISITPMVMGEVPVGAMVQRGAARAGDYIYVSGTLGDACLGLQLRQSGPSARWTLPSEAADHLKRRYLRPEPRLALAPAVLSLARASMDLSDGLLKDLGRMCRASGVGARIEHTSLPVSDAFRMVRTLDSPAADAALFAGDDYEILCGIAPIHAAQFEAAAAKAQIRVTRIGVFTPGTGAVLVDAEGKTVDMKGTGWDHF